MITIILKFEELQNGNVDISVKTPGSAATAREAMIADEVFTMLKGFKAKCCQRTEVIEESRTKPENQ